MPDDQGTSAMLDRLKRRNIIFELIVLSIVGLIIISGIRAVVLRPFVTEGDSMDPTFISNDYLAIDELTYYFHPPQRGDVAVFRYPLDPAIFFIKRVIGIPGDTITITDGVVSIQVRGSKTQQMLVEPYVAPENRKKESSTITLSNDEYFMLGDNRSASSDSRVWGPVPGRYIIGRSMVRLYPLQRFALWPGEYHFAIASGSPPMLSTGKK